MWVSGNSDPLGEKCMREHEFESDQREAGVYDCNGIDNSSLVSEHHSTVHW